MSLPASITDDLLGRLTGLVASSGGDVGHAGPVRRVAVMRPGTG